jgi:RNA polymerase sigma factor (sigma-70 family)
LWQAVRALDEPLRLPVVLRYYHDFPVAEVARLLKVSEGTVHARLDTAREKVAELSLSGEE